MNIILNQCQEKVVNEAVNWFRNSSEQVFEIDGEAGTGKSVTLNAIVERLGLKSYEVLPCSFTGQASIVMRMKGFPNARSIHSTFYRIEMIPIYEDNNGNPLSKPKYIRKFTPLKEGDIDNRVIKLIVIDEGYMVPIQLKYNIEKHGIKILVAGDSGQLPPIGGDPAYLTGNNIHHLTELMRQSKNNPIIYLAHRARRGLPIHSGLYGNRVLVIDESELTKDMVMDIGNIICGTNMTKEKFNRVIRIEKGYGDNPLPQFGERMICRNNNWDKEIDNIALANGLQGYVISPYDITNFVHSSGQYYINFLPDLSSVPFTAIPIDYNYLIADYNNRKIIKQKPYSRGELFEYCYAITTHLAQGAEYCSCIFIEEFLRSNYHNKMCYTGITRAKEYLIYVKPRNKYFL